MKPGRQIAGLASAALVTAAIIFAPASAQAHAGHDHGAPARVSHSEAPPASKACAEQRSLGKRDHQQVPAASQDEAFRLPIDAARGGNCAGGCCNNGLGCCSAVLLAPSQDFPNISYRGAELPSDFAYRPGIDPDALRRPPRSLA